MDAIEDMLRNPNNRDFPQQSWKSRVESITDMRHLIAETDKFCAVADRVYVSEDDTLNYVIAEYLDVLFQQLCDVGVHGADIRPVVVRLAKSCRSDGNNPQSASSYEGLAWSLYAILTVKVSGDFLYACTDRESIATNELGGKLIRGTIFEAGLNATIKRIENNFYACKSKAVSVNYRRNMLVDVNPYNFPAKDWVEFVESLDDMNELISEINTFCREAGELLLTKDPPHTAIATYMAVLFHQLCVVGVNGGDIGHVVARLARLCQSSENRTITSVTYEDRAWELHAILTIHLSGKFLYNCRNRDEVQKNEVGPKLAQHTIAAAGLPSTNEIIAGIYYTIKAKGW